MEKKTSKNKYSNIPVLIICAVIFVALWFIQGRIQTKPNETVLGVAQAMEGLIQKYGIEKGDSMSVMGPLEGLSRSGNASIQGVIAQIQVLLSVVMVLTNRKKGMIAAGALNLFNALYLLAFTFVRSGGKAFPPGIVVSLVTVAIAAIIYAFLARNDKMHEELAESYQEVIENNRIIQEKDEVLQYLAYYDRLTQMPNRQMFMENLEESIANGEEVNIIYVDLDDFRRINDNYGHSTGDELLVAYSRRIEQLCGDDAFAAKIGGDEFGVILGSGLTADDIYVFVTRMSEIFDTPVEIRGEVFTTTASFGAASFPMDARSAEDLFRCAETAMFTAKSGGKNQLCFFRRAQ